MATRLLFHGVHIVFSAFGSFHPWGQGREVVLLGQSVCKRGGGGNHMHLF